MFFLVPDIGGMGKQARWKNGVIASPFSANVQGRSYQESNESSSFSNGSIGASRIGRRRGEGRLVVECGVGGRRRARTTLCHLDSATDVYHLRQARTYEKYICKIHKSFKYQKK